MSSKLSIFKSYKNELRGSFAFKREGSDTENMTISRILHLSPAHQNILNNDEADGMGRWKFGEKKTTSEYVATVRFDSIIQSSFWLECYFTKDEIALLIEGNEVKLSNVKGRVSYLTSNVVATAKGNKVTVTDSENNKVSFEFIIPAAVLDSKINE